MVYLAELNKDSICIGVKIVKNFINDGKHIEIASPDFEYYSWRKYDNGEWSEEKFEPEQEPDPIDQRIADLEQESLMNMLALAELHGLILQQGGDD